jgi:Tfp pilus assembly protein PilE
MITVIAVIAILTGLVLAVSSYAQAKGARARADAEIKMLSSAMESYRTDNGGYPQDATKTDGLDPRTALSADSSLGAPYSRSSQFLYEQLTGDTTDTGQMTKNYAPDFFRPSRLGGSKDASGKVTAVWYIMDPFGNSYGYSTAGLAFEQSYRQSLATAPTTQRPSQSVGYNTTFDLWSTAGDTTGNSAKWMKNW